MRSRTLPRLIIMAKAPVPGRSKTRLCPPCSLGQAAALAEAALADTLAAACGVSGVRTVLALEGAAGPWLPRGVETVAQRGGGLDERLAGVFEDCAGPALLIGMDTPQATADLLGFCIEALLSPGTDAVLGSAEDGGWWAAGLRVPHPAAFLGVPMSTSRTGEAQQKRFCDLGLRVGQLPALRDVDVWEDAVEVAAGCGPGRFPAAVDAVAATLVSR